MTGKGVLMAKSDTGIFSKYIVILLRVCTVLGQVFAHWYQLAMTFYFVTKPRESRWLLPYFIMHLTTSVSLYWIVYRRKQLSVLVSDISKTLRQLDDRAYRSCVKHFTTCFTILLLFTLSQVACVTYLKFMREGYNAEWVQKITFNACNETSACLKYFAISDSYVYAIFMQGLISMYTLIYCYMAHAIGRCVCVLNNKMASNSQIPTLLPLVHREMAKIKNFVYVINKELQYLVLVWLLMVFVLSCNGLLNLITFSYSLLEIYHECFANFHLLVLLFLVAFMAARLEKEITRTRRLLDEMSWLAISQGLAQEVQVIRKMANQRDMILKAGDCFEITSKLFVSYIGFAITYIVLIIQINTPALKIIQNMFGSSKL